NHGRLDIAYKLLLTDTYPSWGYMLKKGATTWWERWNGDTGDPAMNSYNHYAFGSVVAWVYQVLAGIDTTSAAAGFHEITIQPHPDPQITSAQAQYRSVYGVISTGWSFTPNRAFTLKCTIPPNTSAKIVLPEGLPGGILQDGKNAHVTEADGQRFVRVGSGSYVFEMK
ncbi:MAG: alpha-L-rhamnosidase, partial [Acidobacteriaceae bacterium]|nr:alpha-L-rhamnosidase [Acidobacteriaceae bacterium]